jgi:ribosomal protein S18 acetylase RimI-like enzyme
VSGASTVPWSILPVAEEHIDSLREALDAVARERRWLALVEAPTREECAEFVRQHIARGSTQFVAVVAGRVVGWCDVVPMTRPVTRHCGVLGMGVVREFRRRGIGEALLRVALDGARRYGLSRVELTVRPRNRGAIALYEKAGFAHEGVKRSGMSTDGGFEDVVCMGIVLAPDGAGSGER